MRRDRDFVVVATFDSVAEASVVHALLDAHGIAVCPEDTAPVGLVWPVAHLLGATPLRVAAADLEAAAVLVAAYRRGDLAVADEPAPERPARGLSASGS